MENFDNIISEQLDNIIAITYGILEAGEQEEVKPSTIKHLMEKRDRQLQTLYQSKLDKHQLTEEQRQTLRDFFTRFYVLDKRMNRLFAELSLNCKTSIQEIEHHKKAKEAYFTDAPTGTFLNTKVSG